ncbi:MAG: DinB family protein [Ferruginibacter sp.]
MKYLSTQLLDDLYAQSEININKAIKEWQQLPNIRLITQPGPDQWSAAQCLEHLNSYGRYYLPAIEKALTISRHSTPATYFKSGWLGNYFYKMMLVENNSKPKKKLRAPKDHQPGMQLNGAQVVSEFISQQELLEQLLQMAQSKDINKIRIPISISPFIKLKLGDVFLFLIAHINRHLAQAQRALDTTCYSFKSEKIA